MSRIADIGRARRLIMLLGVLVVAGCAPAMGPAGVEFVARQPPAARMEVVGRAPGPGYIWIGGYYVWQRGDFVWTPGRWARPPQANDHRWEPGRWVRARQGWYWVAGHWR